MHCFGCVDSSIEETALELVDLAEDDIIDKLHESYKNQLEEFPAILEECRRLQGGNERKGKENRK